MPRKTGTEESPRFFATAAAFRSWLERNHATGTELWVGFHKKGSGRRSPSWPEAVDQALCFGWIDGIRKSIDADSYKQRFTPRRATSNWSAVNIARVQELRQLGLMHPAGEAAFATADGRTNRYSFEQRDARFSKAQEREFRAQPEAWSFWQAQPPGYRRIATWWVLSAKQDATRARRLATLIADSAAGLRIKQLRR